MSSMKFRIIAVVFLLMAMSLYGQEVVVPLVPYDGTNATYVNAQIVADTVAAGGFSSDRVYEFQRDQYYSSNAIFTVPNGKTLRLRGAAGAGEKPIIYLDQTGTGANPTRPPGYFVVLNGGNIEMKDICLTGYYEWEPDRVSTVQGVLMRNTAPGSSIVLDGVILSNSNGNHIRTEQNTAKVKITNSIFANMGALATSNLGAGKAMDLRDVRCDSLILVNNTFVNYQDRAIRHYTTDATKGVIDYALIEHNTFVNGMGYHGLFSLGNVGTAINIKNNLFVDAFALGEDSTDATRAAEWANTGEIYKNGNNRITWIFSTPNAVTQWDISNNYYTISDSGWAFLNDFGFGPASQLSDHIMGKLGANAANAFTQIDLALGNIPSLMTNMMRWYEDPNGGNKTKNTPSALFDVTTDDMDRRKVEFYRDTLDCSYPMASDAYWGAEGNFPAGDLNWFPNLKAQWEGGGARATIVVDAEKDAFYSALTGPDDGYLQLKSYAFNDNGIPKSDTDLSAKMWFAWDDEWLYFYEEVMDDTISMTSANTYQNDGFELKVDPQPTDSTKNSTFGLEFTALYDTTATGAAKAGHTNINLADSLKQFARKLIPGGYALELAVKWSAITAGTPVEAIVPAVDNVFGAAVQNHDNDNATGARNATVQWAAVLMDASWNTPKYDGTVKFLADNKLQFIPSNNMTGEANPVPYDGTPFYMRIDAKKDPFYRQLAGPADGYLQLRSYAYNDNGKPVDDADLSAKMWTAWDDEWLYFYEEVKDDTISMSSANTYQNDGFELKVDPQATDSTKNSTFGLEMTALYDTTATGTAKAGYSNLNAIADSLKQFARAKVTGGYVLEWAVKWSVISAGSPVENVTVGEGNIFGAVLQNHDNDNTTGKRDATVQWAAVLKDASWNTPKYLGTVTFLADHKLQYVAANAMTGKVNPIADFYDGREWDTAVDETPAIALTFDLAQNYPNPFNPTTMISYSIPQASDVRLSVFDILGREVATLVNENKAAGSYEIVFDGKNLSSGLYFYRIQAGDKVKTQKMMMMK